MGGIKILSAIGMASIQDDGRFGVRQYGIPQSGVMDKNAMHYVNHLVGNALHNPVIEFAIGAISIQAEDDIVLAIAHATADMELPRMINLKSGQSLTLRTLQKKRYGYIAIQGKILAKTDFDSVSTYPLAGLGGLSGKYLKAGDIVQVEGAKKVKNDIWLHDSQSNAIKISRGPEWHLLRSLPTHQRFTISPDSNRMGIRLNESIEIESIEMHSSAVIPGTIQLPPSGQPIVLMNDCQTTGGYPRIAQVIEEDLGKLAQMPVGSEVRFEMVD